MDDPVIEQLQLSLGDSRRVMSAIGIAPAEITAKLGTIAHLARAFIINRAKRELKTTERDYVMGVLPEAVGDATAVIVLVGQIGNMVEWGWYEGVGVDLRKTMLGPGARKVKISKSGHRYMSIPFRHMAPGATGRNAPAMGERYSAVLGTQTANELGKRVYELSKKLAPKLGIPGQITQQGGSLSEAEGGPLLRPRHSTGLYSGMKKVQKAYAGARGSQFMTFRTISDNPSTFRWDADDPNPGINWRHPGIAAHHFFIAAQGYIAEIAPAVWEEK